VLGDQRGLLGLILLRHFLGVAAGRLGGLEFLVLDRDEFRAEAFDLLLGRRPHVGRGDDGAEAARGGDRLQAGDAGAHDENLGGRHRAGRRHHHRQRPAEFGGRVDHGAVAGEIGLARQHVHPLRAGDARQELHGEGDDAGLRHGAQRRLVAVRVHDGDDDRAFLQARQARRFGRRTLSTISAPLDASGRRWRRRRKIRIEDAGLDPGARLDGDLGAKADHLS
jgi:hypothetical protein